MDHQSVCTRCIVCNKNFKTSLVNEKEYSNFTPVLQKIWQLFCKFLNLSLSQWNDIVDFYTKTNYSFCPFCDNCEDVIAELVLLEDELELINKKIDKIRNVILSTIIATCAATTTTTLPTNNKSINVPNHNDDDDDQKGTTTTRDSNVSASSDKIPDDQIIIADRVESLRKSIMQCFRTQMPPFSCQQQGQQQSEEKGDIVKNNNVPIHIKTEPEVDQDGNIGLDQLPPSSSTMTFFSSNFKGSKWKQDDQRQNVPMGGFQFEKIKIESEEEKRTKRNRRSSSHIQLVPKEEETTPVIISTTSAQEEHNNDGDNEEDEDFDCSSSGVEIVESEKEEYDDDDDDDPLYVPPIKSQKNVRTGCLKRKLKNSVVATSIGPKSGKLMTFIYRPPKKARLHTNLPVVSTPSTLSIPATPEQIVACNKAYPKPDLPFSCLAAMAIRNSPGGILPFTEICNFISTHFPYYRCAASGRSWTLSLASSLSSTSSFVKTVKKCEDNKGQVSDGDQSTTGQDIVCWSLHPAKVGIINEDLERMLVDHREGILIAMSDPENLPLMEAGEFYPEKLQEEEEEIYKQEVNDDDEDHDLMIIDC